MAYRNNDIEKYLRGELTPAEMHALEQKALRDPFLADALEGAEHAGAEPFSLDVQFLQRSLYDKTHRKQRAITINRWPLYLGIAASVLLLAVSSFLVLYMMGDQNRAEQPLALKKDQPATDSTLTAQNSATPAEAKQEQVDGSAEAPVDRTGKPQNPETAGGVTTAPVETVVDENLALSEREEQIPEAERQQARGVIRGDDTAVTADEIASEESTRGEGFIAVAPAAKTDSLANATVESRADKSVIRSKREAKVFLSLDKRVRGKVVSSEDGTPLAGVNVLIKGTNKGTITNADGFFNIDLPSGKDSLVFSFIGLTSREVKVQDNGEVAVAMQSDPTQLSEMVVTGYASTPSETKTTPVMEMAEPEGGRNAYKKYLEEQLQYPQQALENQVKGQVTVQFTVQPNGQLSDFQVIKGLGFGCDEELIRLIKEGPAWVPTNKDNQPVQDKVKVQLNFTLPGKKD